MADRWITTSNRAAWLDARRSLVTASDLPVVMGLYGKGRLRDLVREKLGLIPVKKAPEAEAGQDAPPAEKAAKKR